VALLLGVGEIGKQVLFRVGPFGRIIIGVERRRGKRRRRRDAETGTADRREIQVEPVQRVIGDEPELADGGWGRSGGPLQRRSRHSEAGQAPRALSSSSMAAPNCRQRAVLHKISIVFRVSSSTFDSSTCPHARYGLLVIFSLQPLEVDVTSRYSQAPSQRRRPIIFSPGPSGATPPGACHVLSLPASPRPHLTQSHL
jgi:hypothetical protein